MSELPQHPPAPVLVSPKQAERIDMFVELGFDAHIAVSLGRQLRFFADVPERYRPVRVDRPATRCNSCAGVGYSDMHTVSGDVIKFMPCLMCEGTGRFRFTIAIT